MKNPSQILYEDCSGIVLHSHATRDNVLLSEAYASDARFLFAPRRKRAFYVAGAEGAKQMEIFEKKLSELKPYENNPRINNEAVEYVMNSISEFGFKVPIVIDAEGTIVAGHTRWKAAKKLKMKTVPCVVADDLTPEQIKAFRLADNKTAEYAQWDLDKLAEELAGIEMNMEDFGFLAEEMAENNDITEDDTYNNSFDIPHYEITGECPPLKALVDEDKCNELIAKIDAAEDVPEDVKDFLRKAATRHFAFNYRNVAEYYAHAPKEVQELMEESALVIIDLDNAIRNGYVKLNADIEALMAERDENDE